MRPWWCLPGFLYKRMISYPPVNIAWKFGVNT
jgi:hypothetical protein